MGGTKKWQAPEHFRHRGITIQNAKKTDVYSFGKMCLWLLFFIDDEHFENYSFDVQGFEKLCAGNLELLDLFTQTLAQLPEHRRPLEKIHFLDPRVSTSSLAIDSIPNDLSETLASKSNSSSLRCLTQDKDISHLADLTVRILLKISSTY